MRCAIQPQNGAEQCGFASTVAPQHRDEAAVRDTEIYGIQHPPPIADNTQLPCFKNGGRVHGRVRHGALSSRCSVCRAMALIQSCQ